MVFYHNLFNESYSGNIHMCPVFPEDERMLRIRNVLAFPKLLSD